MKKSDKIRYLFLYTMMMGCVISATYMINTPNYLFAAVCGIEAGLCGFWGYIALAGKSRGLG